MIPVLFRIGPFHLFGTRIELPIYSYGTMMAVAFIVAGYLTGRELRRRGLPEEAASSMVVSAAIGGIVGSRLWAIAEAWQEFLRDPLSMILTGSGFVWYGGLLGGILGVYLTVRRGGLPWLEVTDCAAPALALGHAIGRIGCQLAGDGDWGKVSELPWAMAYPNAIVGWPYPPGVRVHPTPLYEALAYTVVFVLLWGLRKRPFPAGTLFWLYLVLAPAARFAIEFVRINPPVLLGLSAAQLVSLALVLLGGVQLARSAAHGRGT